jgi:hypothetical protein
MLQSLVMLTAEELLSGANVLHEVAVPADLLGTQSSNGRNGMVQVRPLTIGIFQTIMKAAKDDPSLVPLLMVKEGLVEPKLSIQQVRELPVGLVEFFVAQIRAVSGLTEKKTF